MTASRLIKVGSRTSLLSRAQTEEVLNPLQRAHPGVDFDVIAIATQGDRRKDAPLLSVNRGMFVKEIEEALLRSEIDIAVHSAKDMLATAPNGLTIGAFGKRQDPRDALINRWGLPFEDMPPGARIGTSSPRRAAQLKSIRPDVEIVPIRGNVDTRLEKAKSGEYDGVVLAAAGLARLGRSGEITEHLPEETCVPEVGQGALAVEARTDDDDVLEMLREIDDRPTRDAVEAERAFLRTIGGGCQVPVAAYARLEGGVVRVSTMAALPDGSRVFRSETSASAADPDAAGRRSAEDLMRSGAGEIIARGRMT